jgi:hypothetical protein
MYPVLGHGPSLWITHKENGLIDGYAAPFNQFEARLAMQGGAWANRRKQGNCKLTTHRNAVRELVSRRGDHVTIPIS